jgi:hypothetical protein
MNKAADCHTFEAFNSLLQPCSITGFNIFWVKVEFLSVAKTDTEPTNKAIAAIQHRLFFKIKPNF